MIDFPTHSTRVLSSILPDLAFLSLTMASVEQLLEKAQSCSNPKESERIYKQILSTVSGEGCTRILQPNLRGSKEMKNSF
jgi:hypothetical protein